MAAETIELDEDAFMRLVTEEHLQVEGPSQGFLYTGKRGKNGWELYKTSAIDGWDSCTVKQGNIARPAAGANYAAVTISTTKRTKLLGFYFAFTTDANVANRYVTITTGLSAATDRATGSATPITASIASQQVGFGAGSGTGGAVGAGLLQTVGMGDGIELAPNGYFQIVIVGLQATDRPDGACKYAYKEMNA